MDFNVAYFNLCMCWSFFFASLWISTKFWCISCLFGGVNPYHCILPQSWKIHPLHVGTWESEMQWETSLQLKMQKMYGLEHAIQSCIIIYLRCWSIIYIHTYIYIIYTRLSYTDIYRWYIVFLTNFVIYWNSPLLSFFQLSTDHCQADRPHTLGGGLREDGQAGKLSWGGAKGCI